MNTTLALKITALVNEKAALKLVFKKIVPDGSILCHDEDDRRHAIVCYGGLMSPIIRSVVRERMAGKGFTWTPNGQAGKNAVQVARWTESHRYQPSASDVVEVLDQAHPEGSWVDLLRCGGFHLPDNVSLDEVLSLKTLTDQMKETHHVQS